MNDNEEVFLEETDKEILNQIQSDFPINPRPFKAIADRVGLTETEVISRIARLKEAGIIRRIGGNFVPEKLGYISTLCAANVPEYKIDDFTRAVNSYPGVTHNYQRDGKYNIWFTFIASSIEEIENNLKQISAKTGIQDILNLPATRVFKIKAEFTV